MKHASELIEEFNRADEAKIRKRIEEIESRLEDKIEKIYQGIKKNRAAVLLDGNKLFFGINDFAELHEITSVFQWYGYKINESPRKFMTDEDEFLIIQLY